MNCDSSDRMLCIWPSVARRDVALSIHHRNNGTAYFLIKLMVNPIPYVFYPNFCLILPFLTFRQLELQALVLINCGETAQVLNTETAHDSETQNIQWFVLTFNIILSYVTIMVIKNESYFYTNL